jgi:hypothetical protein
VGFAELIELRSSLMFQLKNIWLALTIALSACAQTSEPAADAQPVGGFHQCPAQRPQMCTLDYNPVCAIRDAVVQPTFDLKTYSNGCSACSDAKVTGYFLGACKNQ